MRSWAYLTVGLAMTGHHWQVRWINGTELPHWGSGPARFEHLNRLGAEGWDMCGSGSGGGGQEAWCTYILKRPQAQPRRARA